MVRSKESEGSWPACPYGLQRLMLSPVPHEDKTEDDALFPKPFGGFSKDRCAVDNTIVPGIQEVGDRVVPGTGPLRAVGRERLDVGAVLHHSDPPATGVPRGRAQPAGDSDHSVRST